MQLKLAHFRNLNMIREGKWMAKLRNGVSRKTVSGARSYRALFLLEPLTPLLARRWENLATRYIECTTQGFFGFGCTVVYRSVQSSYLYTSGVTFFRCFYLCKILTLVQNKHGLSTV